MNYWVSSFEDAERQNDTMQRIAFAVERFISLHQPYMEDHKFSIHIAHDVLKWILNFYNSTTIMAQ